MQNLLGGQKGLYFCICCIAGRNNKGFFGKRISNEVKTQRQLVPVNAVRMAICVLISLAVLLPDACKISAAMSAVFFKEKITPRCVVGLVLEFISILLLK